MRVVWCDSPLATTMPRRRELRNRPTRCAAVETTYAYLPVGTCATHCKSLRQLGHPPDGCLLGCQHEPFAPRPCAFHCTNIGQSWVPLPALMEITSASPHTSVLQPCTKAPPNFWIKNGGTHHGAKSSGNQVHCTEPPAHLKGVHVWRDVSANAAATILPFEGVQHSVSYCQRMAAR